MIDFHSHILPCADHGCDSLDTSLAQIKMAEAAGIQTLIATPHFYPQVEELDSFLERRKASYKLLCKAYHGQINIRLGAEVHMCAGLDHMDGLENLCINGTDVLLLELGFRTWTQEVYDTVVRLYEDGKFVPVLAHIDRYNPDAIDNFLSLGIKAQINADAFCRFTGRAGLCDRIDSGAAVALGSDIHGTKIGYSRFLKAKKYLAERFDVLMERAEKLIY